MDFIAQHPFYVAGAAAVILGFLIRQWFGRYDLKEMAIESFWQLARGERTAETPTDIERKYHDIASAATTLGKARRATGSIIGHFLAQLMGLVGLVLILGGLVLLGVGYFVG